MYTMHSYHMRHDMQRSRFSTHGREVAKGQMKGLVAVGITEGFLAGMSRHCPNACGLDRQVRPTTYEDDHKYKCQCLRHDSLIVSTVLSMQCCCH